MMVAVDGLERSAARLFVVDMVKALTERKQRVCCCGKKEKTRSLRVKSHFHYHISLVSLGHGEYNNNNPQ